MDCSGCRVWGYAVLAWIVLVVVPIGYAAIRWQMGFGHDPDMNGVGELVSLMLFVITVPMAALAFFLFAPLAFLVDGIARGRTPRFVNVLVGGALSVPALIVSIVAVGWPEHDPRDALSVLGHLDRAPGFVTAVLLAGLIVGLGLRHSSPRGQHPAANR